MAKPKNKTRPGKIPLSTTKIKQVNNKPSLTTSQTEVDNSLTAKPRYPLFGDNLKKAIEMRLKGIGLEDIGIRFGVSKQAVHKALKPYIDNEEIDISIWKEKRADLLAGKQATALSELTVEDLKKASPKDKALIFGILYDKERLERGQSTSNVATILASAVVEATEQRVKRATTDTEADTETIDGEVIAHDIH